MLAVRRIWAAARHARSQGSAHGIPYATTATRTGW